MFTSTNQAETQHATCDSLPLKGTYLDPLLAEVARIGDIVREDARANVKALQQFAASTLGTNLTLYKATDEIMKDEDEDGMYRSGAKETAAAVLKQFPTKTMQSNMNGLAKLMLDAGSACKTTSSSSFFACLRRVVERSGCTSDTLNKGPIKRPSRVMAKLCMRVDKLFKFETCRDVVRAMFRASNASEGIKLRNALKAEPDLKVVGWKDRVSNPTSGGW